MPKPSIEEAVAQYALKRPIYEAFSGELQHLLTSLLGSRGVRFQTIETRPKSIDSFREKLSRSGKTYNDPLTEMPDLCGCRIISYYGDDVETISRILKEEFDIIEEELSHQPAHLDADRFGYLSVHYVFRINRVRSRLAEWAPYKDLHAEVQIRTVIQHAWSAVSHALQYKQETGIPSALRRRLFRIAGLFELADEEFVSIRLQREELERTAADLFSKGDRDLALTSTTLSEFVKSWDAIPVIEKSAAEAGFTVQQGIDPDDPYTSEIYKLAEKEGKTTIAELQAALTPPPVEIFSKIFSELNSEGWTTNTDFLVALLLLAKFPENASDEFLSNEKWADPMKSAVISAAGNQE